MERLLMVGCKGDDVKAVQSHLNGQPPSALAPLAVDGVFGPLTEARVKEYQRRNQLGVDGIVGPQTLAALKKRVRIVLARTGPQFRPVVSSAGRFGLFASPVGRTAAVVPGSSELVDIGIHKISNLPAMPRIDLDVKIDGVSPDPTPTTLFTWVVDITFVPAESCAFGKPGVRFQDGFTVPNVLGGSFSPIFPWIRGGNLTLAARAGVGANMVEAVFCGTIVGTDPDWSVVSPTLGTDVMRRLTKHESLGGHQFVRQSRDPRMEIVPVFNNSNRDGGVGLCQITPNPAVQMANNTKFKDAVWNWRMNVEQGREVFAGKRVAALQHLNQHRVNGRFPNNGDRHGPGRVGNGVDDDTVVMWEIIQRYNGGFHWRWNPAINLWESRPQFNQTHVASVLAQTP